MKKYLLLVSSKASQLIISQLFYVISRNNEIERLSNQSHMFY